MSPKKNIFFIILGCAILGLIGGMYYISSLNNTISKKNEDLVIWIDEGLTSSYDALIADFKKSAPEYANAQIKVQKPTEDNSEKYRLLLLNSTADGNGPDIFMVHSGEDILLENKIESIPSTVLDFKDFESRYDSLFHSLVYKTGSKSNASIMLKGVPLGYETLGIFFNKGLIREVPRTWNDIDRIANDMPPGVYMTNFGLGPIYTPNMIDTLPLWISDPENSSYTSLEEKQEGLMEYYTYRNQRSNQLSGEEDGENDTNIASLADERSTMIKNKKSTLDLFAEGRIAMIVGYPSLILKLEKSIKRSGRTGNSTILTERLPQKDNQSSHIVGRYSYFALSRSKNHGDLAIRWMQYLMTPQAQQLYMQSYPYMIPAQSEFYASAEQSMLSSTINKARLDPFIPKIGDTVSIYSYGVKSGYEKFIRESWDLQNIPDMSIIIEKINNHIACEITISIGNLEDNDCSIEP